MSAQAKRTPNKGAPRQQEYQNNQVNGDEEEIDEGDNDDESMEQSPDEEEPQPQPETPSQPSGRKNRQPTKQKPQQQNQGQNDQKGGGGGGGGLADNITQNGTVDDVAGQGQELVGGATDNAVGKVGDAVNNGPVGGLTGGLTGDKGKEEDKDEGGEDQLRLRIDLNLDIELQLKAKIHGDITLGLLYVCNPSTIQTQRIDRADLFVGVDCRADFLLIAFCRIFCHLWYLRLKRSLLRVRPATAPSHFSRSCFSRNYLLLWCSSSSCFSCWI